MTLFYWSLDNKSVGISAPCDFFRIAVFSPTHPIKLPNENTYKLRWWRNWLRIVWRWHRRHGHLMARWRWYCIHWWRWRSGSDSLWCCVPIEHREWIAPFVVSFISRLLRSWRRSFAKLSHQTEILFVNVAGGCARIAVFGRCTTMTGSLGFAVFCDMASSAARCAHNIIGDIRFVWAQPAFVVIRPTICTSVYDFEASERMNILAADLVKCCFQV